jgi:hypothetical protein
LGRSSETRFVALLDFNDTARLKFPNSKQVVPRAVLFYTGEAADDYDEFDEEDDEEGGESDDQSGGSGNEE